MVKVLADIIGAAATVALTTDRSLIARGWVQVGIIGADGRVGDSNTTVARGIPVPDGGSTFLPAPPDSYTDAYVLADLYAYIPTGAKVTVSYLE